MENYKYLGEIEEVSEDTIKLDSGKGVKKLHVSGNVGVGQHLYAASNGLNVIFAPIPVCGLCDIRLIQGDDKFMCPNCNEFFVHLDEPDADEPDMVEAENSFDPLEALLGDMS